VLGGVQDFSVGAIIIENDFSVGGGVYDFSVGGGEDEDSDWES